MTVSKNPTSYKLSLEVANGVDALGAAKTKSDLIGDVRLGAADDKCYAVAEAIGELMTNTIVGVCVTEKAELAKEE